MQILQRPKRSRRVLFGVLSCLAALGCAGDTLDSAHKLTEYDSLIRKAMDDTGTKGLAIAMTHNGEVVFRKTYGFRNGLSDPVTPDTVMYGASLTKSVFAVYVMQLVEEGKLELDRPLANYLSQPLPSYSSEADAQAYAPWAGLEGDERWRKITARMVLNHSTGFANFAFLEPDGKLRIHFEPGSRYAYSGAGIMLLQFVIERGLGLNVGDGIQRRIFDKAGMTRTSLKWRSDFANNLADGFKADGTIEPHDERSRVRAAGSMDTTISDFAAFSAALNGGRLISRTSLQELSRGTLPIKSNSQFLTLLPEPIVAPFASVSAGLGVVTFNGPQGLGFYKGGHNDSTGNTWVCVNATRRCVIILSNDVRAEAAFPAIVTSILGETGAPWGWEYSGMAFWEPK